MPTIVATALADTATLPSLGAALVDQLRGHAAKLVLVFASPAHDLRALVAKLRATLPEATVLGATTAGEFTERGDAKKSVAAFAISGDFEVAAGAAAGIGKDPEGALTRALSTVPREREGYPHATCILLVDPLSGVSEELTLLAAGLLGEHISIVGGAAGDDLAMSRTEVACDTFCESDGVVAAVLFSRTPLGLGVAHGHDRIAGPFVVTRAEGNVVHELDGRPAWDVWRQHTKDAARHHGFPDDLPDDQLGAYLLRFEGGVETGVPGEALKIRAPLTKQKDGSLGFACGVPTGTSLFITESDVARQVAAARAAGERARDALGGRPAAGAIVFDCICRNLILGGGFAEVPKVISEVLGGAPLAGFETYGEIAMEEGQLSGFHNTTSVVLAFPKGE